MIGGSLDARKNPVGFNFGLFMTENVQIATTVSSC